MLGFFKKNKEQKELCLLSDLEEGKVIKAKEKRKHLLLTKYEGEVLCYENNCPHLGVPLDLDTGNFIASDKEHFECQSHGALFKINNGLCISGPCRSLSLNKIDIEIIEDKIFTK